MEILESRTEGNAVTDILQHIDRIADWLRQEAQSFEKPNEQPRRGVIIKRYRLSATIGHRRPTYLLRRR